MKCKVLIVEDEAELRDMMCEELSAFYDVATAEDAESARKLAKKFAPDVALLDVRLRDSCGLKLCEALRSDPLTKRTKVIMVTGQNDRETILRSFQLGADDYIAKPFYVDELLARVSSKILRSQEEVEAREILSCGNLTLLPDELSARVGERVFRLSPLEFTLLRFFLENGEKIASREKILEKVWPGTSVSDRTVDSHVVSLRKKLADFDHEILTVYGAGYALKRKPGLSLN